MIYRDRGVKIVDGVIWFSRIGVHDDFKVNVDDLKGPQFLKLDRFAPTELRADGDHLLMISGRNVAKLFYDISDKHAYVQVIEQADGPISVELG